MAMGATPTDVLRLILGRGLALALAGVLSGMVAAYIFARAVKGLLYGVGAADPATFLTAPIFLLGVAVAANLAPALRASRTDPMTALRHE